MIQVMLVHGMWRTPLCMYGMGRRLSRAGHQPVLFANHPVVQTFEGIVTRLHTRLQRMAEEGPYAAVGYSLGGVLLRAAVPHVRGRSPEHIVFLGTPNRPPRLATQLGDFAPYKWFTGECGSRLASEDFYSRLPVPEAPYTIIAGSWGPVGRWSPFGDDENDGLVSISETLIRDDDEPIVMPISHAMLPHSTPVQQRVVEIMAKCDAPSDERPLTSAAS